MRKINANTKEAARVLATFNSAWANKGDINNAYKKPSARKVKAYNDIWYRAMRTEGYNHDLRVTGANCHMFTTMYSVTNDDGTTSIIYDTPSNTSILTI